ncbi:MAG: YcbK family protein [Methylophilaceae bacterium]
MKNQICMTRRKLLKSSVALAVTGFSIPSALATVNSYVTKDSARVLNFHNLHTGEALQAEYWADGHYLTDELAGINHILRDFRTNQVLPIEPLLLDLLHQLRTSLNTTQPFQIISGYRSPVTNANLAANSDGVAKHSLHMEGKAIDLRIDGINLSNLRQAAIALQGGGVGYYPGSNFVHMDVGRVRSWG